MKSSPHAAPVIVGNARFTWITPRLLRLEWAEQGAFEDRGTLAVTVRPSTRVTHESTRRGSRLTSHTEALTVDFSDDGQPFHRGNLRLSFKLGGRTVVWRPGDEDLHNLGGTLRTLDAMDGDIRHVWMPLNDGSGDWAPLGTEQVRLPNGLLSRSGWSLTDDSGTVVLEPDARAPSGRWVQARDARHKQDWYFLAGGHDHAQGLADAALLFGAQPLPPRFAFGYWYSRYWAYTDREVLALVEAHRERSIPLDVMVIDMDWHLPGWTGYTWDARFFPAPAETLARLHAAGVHVTLNLHPADGVAPHEAMYRDFCVSVGHPADGQAVPFDITDPDYMRAYFTHLHHPMETQGVDFWWMDWQQGSASKLTGLDPLPWLNDLHWHDAARNPDKRPVGFSRFGGLGSGRYPIGFSGDTHCSWPSLAYQTDFTATAANVLYGYWSHDIGGHFGDHFTPEMYLRWVQFGCYSPILRTHTTKDAKPQTERRLWAFADPYGTELVATLRRRYALIPYIYTACRKGYTAHTSLLRPMYHGWPQLPAAYEARHQYLFGPDLLVAPVVAPVDADGEAQRAVWLPPGTWLDLATGEWLKGGRRWERRYRLDEIPVFARPGTIIPEQGPVANLRAPCYPELRFRIIPGDSGQAELYEDDGCSEAYRQGQGVWLDATWTADAQQAALGLKLRRGAPYPGYQPIRPVRVELEASLPPRLVRLGRRTIPHAPMPTAGHWWYEADQARVVIDLGDVDLRRATTLTVLPTSSKARIDGLPGLLRRLEAARVLVCQASTPHPLHPEERLIVGLAQTGNRLCRAPEHLEPELLALRRGLRRLIPSLVELEALLASKPAHRHRAPIIRQALAALEATRAHYPAWFRV